MKKHIRIALLHLACLTAFIGTATAETILSPQAPAFTNAMVSGKTMVSSGYPAGTMTFNSNGSLTCSNYPASVHCISWRVQTDGTLFREFSTSKDNAAVLVQAYWKLLSKSGNNLQVSQTSNNSSGATVLTVTVQ